MNHPAQGCHIPTLGLRIHHARRLAGLTLKQVALSAGCSESMLSKIEHNHTQPSLGMLKRIADALGTSVAQLTDEALLGPNPVLRATQRPRRMLRQANAHSYIEALLPPSKGALLQGEIRHLAPKMLSEIQTHIGQVLIYVLQGELEVTLANVHYRLFSGDSMSFSGTDAYRYQNPSTQESQVLWVISPATL